MDGVFALAFALTGLVINVYPDLESCLPHRIQMTIKDPQNPVVCYPLKDIKQLQENTK